MFLPSFKAIRETSILENLLSVYCSLDSKVISRTKTWDGSSYGLRPGLRGFLRQRRLTAPEGAIEVGGPPVASGALHIAVPGYYSAPLRFGCRSPHRLFGSVLESGGTPIGPA